MLSHSSRLPSFRACGCHSFPGLPIDACLQDALKSMIQRVAQIRPMLPGPRNLLPPAQRQGTHLGTTPPPTVLPPGLPNYLAAVLCREGDTRDHLLAMTFPSLHSWEHKKCHARLGPIWQVKTTTTCYITRYQCYAMSFWHHGSKPHIVSRDVLAPTACSGIDYQGIC